MHEKNKKIEKKMDQLVKEMVSVMDKSDATLALRLSTSISLLCLYLSLQARLRPKPERKPLIEDITSFVREECLRALLLPEPNDEGGSDELQR